MSILETFYLLFKADTSDVKKGLDESTKTAEQTVDVIGQKFSNLSIKLAGFVASLLSINAVLSGIKNTISYDINISKESRITGVSPDELDAWSNAVVNAGGSVDDFQNSLQGLASHFHTTAAVAIQALPQLAEVFSRISRYSAFNYGKAIGLNESTILLLQQGRREVESIIKQQRDLGVVTKEDAEISFKYNQELGNLNHSFRTLYNAIAIPLLPALTSFFQLLEKGLGYLTDHRDLVVGAFVGIGAAAFSAALAFAPLSIEVIGITAAVILLISLFALLWEDIKVYFRGGKSLIGEYIEEWKKLGKTIEEIIEGWTEKFLKFLDKFSLFKPISDYIRDNMNNDNSVDVIKKSNAKDFFLFSSSTPLNNATSAGHFYNSAFSKNSTINTGDIIINTQATDAVGISKEIGLKFDDLNYFASNNFADGIHA